MRLCRTMQQKPNAWRAMSRLIMRTNDANRRKTEQQLAIVESAVLFLAASNKQRSFGSAPLTSASAPGHHDELAVSLRHSNSIGVSERVRTINDVIAFGHLRPDYAGNQTSRRGNTEPGQSPYFQIVLIVILAIGICSGPLLWRVWDGLSPRELTAAAPRSRARQHRIPDL